MSRILIVSDIHGNKDALDAVVADAGPTERIWCLGDMVGYGPEPRACLAWARDHCEVVLSGNHDYAIFDPEITRDFNPNAALAAEWTRGQLSDEEMDYLRGLESIVAIDGVTLAHGSPADPIWTYILTVVDALEAFGAFSGDLCFVGHSHVAGGFVQDDAGISRQPKENDTPLALANGRFIINPGSVGQPRDRDPRAAYLWYEPETSTVTWKRVAYPVEVTQAKIRDAGLPERLAQRLAVGH